MREWNLKGRDPLCLTLAADVRLGPTDYCDDQIWELTLAGGEPPALAVQTTFGLRARSLRLFPRFVVGDEARIDPPGFARPPAIHRVYPNYIRLSYAPFTSLDVQAEYWVPQSHAIAGRLQIRNSSRMERRLRLEWVGLLNPDEGERMGPSEIQAAPVLAGSTGNLVPVIIMTGGPHAGSGSYPSLNFNIELESGATREFIWVQATLENIDSSFSLARSIASRKWEAEIARLDLLNQGLVDIYTGNADWDAALAMSQKAAFNLLSGPTANLPHPSFVFNRLPDQGYSMRGTGSDYNHLWSGQTPLEAYYLAGLILPSSPDLAAGLLQNYLSVQDKTGFIDWKPGLGGQRSHVMATPLLVSLGWRIFQANQDKTWLEEVFPPLLRFVQAWFDPAHDRDGDGLPEWDHPMQSGYEDSPIFSRWNEWSQAVDITAAESPALCAFLYRECKLLTVMAEMIGRSEALPSLQMLADLLSTAIEASWDKSDHSYHFWDRDTHLSPMGMRLVQHTGSGEILVGQNFEQPQRLQVRIRLAGESTRRPQVFIHGTNISGNPRVERLEEDRFRWYMGRGSLTSDKAYLGIDSVEIMGLDPADKVELFTVDFHIQDHTLLLPLWAGIPSSKRAKEIIRYWLKSSKRYDKPFGIPARPGNSQGLPETSAGVRMPWNSLIGSGLVHYGDREKAADLVSRLMEAVVQTLKSEGGFRRVYHAETGHGSGERNALQGLAPLDLFLEVLGVRLLSPLEVLLEGMNPFPWPVTVKYRGMTVLKQKDKSMVIFPDGQTIVVRDPAPCLVTLDHGEGRLVK